MEYVIYTLVGVLIVGAHIDGLTEWATKNDLL